MEWIVQKRYGGSILGDTQNSTEQGSKQPALDSFALIRVLDLMTFRIPF